MRGRRKFRQRPYLSVNSLKTIGFRSESFPFGIVENVNGMFTFPFFAQFRIRDKTIDNIKRGSVGSNRIRGSNDAEIRTIRRSAAAVDRFQALMMLINTQRPFL